MPSLDALVPADPEVVGDLKSLLAALAEWAPEGGDWGETAAKTFRQQVSDALDTPSTGLSPQRAMEVARAVLPRDTIATCDAGREPAAGGAEVAGLRAARVPGLQWAGLHGLCGARRAWRARLAHPDRPVVAFTGDGGFLMAVAELQTAQREKLPDHRRRVRRPGDRPHPRQAGDQGHPAARRQARRRRLGEAGHGLRRRRDGGRDREGAGRRALPPRSSRAAPP